MLPEHFILSIIGVFLAQGNAVQALPAGRPIYTRNLALSETKDVIRVPDPPHSLSLDKRDNTLEARSAGVSTAVAAVAIPALCTLGHKILMGVIVYVNCPEPVRNLKEAFGDLAKAGKQAINFEPNSDFNARHAAVIAAAPPNIKVPLGQAIWRCMDETVKASMIIFDTAGSSVYRAGGYHSQVGGTPLNPAVPLAMLVSSSDYHSVPASNAESPTAVAGTPGNQAGASGAQAATPSTQAGSPIAQAETPGNQPGSATAKAATPSNQAEASGAQAHPIFSGAGTLSKGNGQSLKARPYSATLKKQNSWKRKIASSAEDLI